MRKNIIDNLKVGDTIILPANKELDLKKEKGSILEINKEDEVMLVEVESEDMYDDGLREVSFSTLINKE